MAEDWAANVKKYVSDADDAIIAGIVRYCGIALQKRDSSLVSFTDSTETDRVRNNFLKKKLALPHADDVLDAAIAAVGQRMKGENFKNRVTVYYLLAEHFGMLDMFAGKSKSKAKAADAGAGAAAGAAAGAGALGLAALSSDGDGDTAVAASPAAPEPTPAATPAAAVEAPAAAAGLAAAGASAATVSSATAETPSAAAAAPQYMTGHGDAGGNASAPATTSSDDDGGTLGWLWWLLLALLAALLIWWLFFRQPATDTAANSAGAPAAATAAVGDAAAGGAAAGANDAAADLAAAPAEGTVTIPQGAGVTVETRDNAPVVKVYFDSGKVDVAPAFTDAAGGLKAWLAANAGKTLAVSGYNDASGNAAANAELSKNRAKAVAAALVAAGVPEASVALVKPENTTDTTVAKDAARRVEVTVR